MKSVGKVLAADLNREVSVYAKTGESNAEAIKRVEKAHSKGRPPGAGSFSISKGHLKKGEENEPNSKK